MAKICVLGLGYVGLVTGAVFARMGHMVVGVDVIQEKVDAVNKRRALFFEPGLDDLLKKVVPDRLRATGDPKVISSCDFSFICVGTPSSQDGTADLSHLDSAAEAIGRHMRPGHIVVVKSTVPPRTTEERVIPILEETSGMSHGEFHVAMNPEFLREGSALHDAYHPDRILVGSMSDEVSERVLALYRDIDPEVPRLSTSLKTAEMVKYASNAFLAIKISFSNEVARICESLGIDVYEVMDLIALDRRINREFLNAGLGFGGSCFPKDLRALRSSFESLGLKAELVDAALRINETQPLKAVETLERLLNGLKDRRVAVLGLAFKPDTDDVRETRSYPLIRELVRRGSLVVAHDPRAIRNFSSAHPDLNVEFASDLRSAVNSADAVVIQTEWEDYRNLSPEDLSRMRGDLVYDGRRALKHPELLARAGLRVFLLGRGLL